ncbi:hypothetical protein RBB78_16790 [Tunturiibacter empetritectus]|uniref:hypothetical protein n=1 Tax=Tunturiibacter empetritectus TaxID=3069691 RepID=UPI003D9B373D
MEVEAIRVRRVEEILVEDGLRGWKHTSARGRESWRGNNNRPPPRPTPSRPPPRPNPSRPRPPSGRPPQWGRPPQQRPSYSFRRNDWGYLHNYYRRNLGYINIATRPRFVIGGFFPYAYIPYITALPPNVYGYLPPPPPGYNMGYYDGYVVVYDPLTYFIANVVDLLQEQ